MVETAGFRDLHEHILRLSPRVVYFEGKHPGLVLRMQFRFGGSDEKGDRAIFLDRDRNDLVAYFLHGGVIDAAFRHQLAEQIILKGLLFGGDGFCHGEDLVSEIAVVIDERFVA